MRNYFVLIIVGLFYLNGFSTHQVEDYLIRGNDTLFFYESPLEQINDISEKVRKITGSDFLSSGCWRGFYAEWKLIDNILYLSKVFDCENDKPIKNILNKLFGHNSQNGLMKATWVKGIFWCGKDLVREKTFYLSVYRYEYKMRLLNGVVENVMEYPYTPCKYSNSKKIKDFVLSGINRNVLPKDKFVKAEFEFEIKFNIKGQIENVTLTSLTNSDLKNEVLRMVNLLPCYPVYFIEGEVYSDTDWISFTIYESEINSNAP